MNAASHPSPAEGLPAAGFRLGPAVDEATGTAVQRLTLPWKAWVSDLGFHWDLPAEWEVDVLPPFSRASATAEEIGAALDSPIGTPPLEELARGAASACIAVDDLARPTRAGEVVSAMLPRLNAAGVPNEKIRVVVATGTHGDLSERHRRWKLGEVCDRVQVEVHSAHGDLVDTGIPYGPLTLKINRTFWESEFKMAIGCAMPHSFAGFSGGAKLVLPGMADVPATARSHQFVQMGLRGGADPDKNRFRTEIEELARRIGLKFIVTVLPDAGRRTGALFAGDVVEAHRAACRMAKEVYDTPIRRTADVLLLNAYPKDVDLVQAETVMVALKSLPEPPLSPDGLVILATAASEGLGRHGLFEPGGANYRVPKPIRALKGRPLWLFAPGVDEATAHRMYSPEYPFFDDAQTMIQAIQERFTRPLRLAALPAAPMQVLRDERGA